MIVYTQNPESWGNMSHSDADLLCSACKGTSEIPCDCDCPNCEGVTSCEECGETGLNENLVDVAKWQEALDELRTRLGYAPRYATECGVLVGRSAFGGRKHKLLIRDFLLPGVSAQ